MDFLGRMATFVRVVEAKSLSAAARDLGVSLPAVSRQLRALEGDVGTTLLVRTTRRMALTERGRDFYERAVRILSEVEEARARMGPLGEARGTLVVSAPISVATHLLLPRLPALTQKHPRLTIDLRIEDRLVDFVREGIDVAIRGGVPPPDSNAYVAAPLARFRRVAVAAPSYVRKRGAPRAPEDLTRHACLIQVGSVGTISQWRFVREDDETVSREVHVNGPVRSNAPLALRELARDGIGVALVADWLVARELGEGTLRRVLPHWRSETVTTWAVFRAEKKSSPLLDAFLREVRELVAPRR